MEIEYKTVVFEVPRKASFFSNSPEVDSVEEIDQQLAKLGRDGWQLVGVFPITDGSNPAQISQAIHYFSRPKLK